MEDSLKIPNIDLLEECIELLNEGKTVLLTAKGDSMLPFIRDREKIILQKAETYRRGDIVLARTDNGTTVLHRIIRTGNGTATLEKREMPLIRNQGQGNINLWKERHPPHLIMEAQMSISDMAMPDSRTQVTGQMLLLTRVLVRLTDVMDR